MGTTAARKPWVAGLASAMRQGEDAADVGFLDEDGTERLRAAYPGATRRRLAAVKKEYDPTNLFRLNMNITPSA